MNNIAMFLLKSIQVSVLNEKKIQILIEEKELQSDEVF